MNPLSFVRCFLRGLGYEKIAVDRALSDAAWEVDCRGGRITPLSVLRREGQTYIVHVWSSHIRFVFEDAEVTIRLPRSIDYFVRDLDVEPVECIEEEEEVHNG